VLTQYLSWRWCLYVNIGFAAVAVSGALRLLTNQPRDPDVRLDPPGTVLVIAGLVALVYGLSQAETKGWGAGITDILLVAGVVLLAAFVVVERRAEHPLLPMRVLLSRSRGGAYLAIGLSAIAMFGIFLFLTYYLQETLGYSPVKTGLAFLPMIGGLMLSSTSSAAVLLPRVGPRPLIPLGMVLSACGMVLLTQIGLHTSYGSGVLPGLVVVGLGIGLVFGCAMNTATAGADPEDAGVASALVNTNQQIGGSIGTALLNTIAASALTSYLVSHGHTPAALAQASVHSYATAFWVVVGIFAGAAIVCALVLPSGAPRLSTAAEVAPAIG
jgi:MFS family permease